MKTGNRILDELDRDIMLLICEGYGRDKILKVLPTSKHTLSVRVHNFLAYYEVPGIQHLKKRFIQAGIFDKYNKKTPRPPAIYNNKQHV